MIVGAGVFGIENSGTRIELINPVPMANSMGTLFGDLIAEHTIG